MLHTVGVNWNNMPIPFKRGRVIRRVPNSRTVSFVHKKTQKLQEIQVEEMAWTVDEKIPVFTKEKSYLEGLVP
jgi:tRNA(His) 5'-end guanylyltransferase